MVVLSQLGIGLCLVLGRLERVAIVVSVPYALGVWWIGEGLGGIPSGFAMVASGAPGAVLLHAIIGFLALPDVNVVVDAVLGEGAGFAGKRDRLGGQPGWQARARIPQKDGHRGVGCAVGWPSVV